MSDEIKNVEVELNKDGRSILALAIQVSSDKVAALKEVLDIIEEDSRCALEFAAIRQKQAEKYRALINGLEAMREEKK